LYNPVDIHCRIQIIIMRHHT